MLLTNFSSKMLYQILLILGIICFLISVVTLIKSINFIKSGNKTIGKVIELEESHGDGGRIMYKAVFQFNTSSNEPITFKESAETSPASFDLGEQIGIVYDSSNPSNAKVMTYFGAFGLTIIFAAISMPLIIIGGGYFLSQIYLK